MGFKFKIGDEASKKWIGSINIEDVQQQYRERETFNDEVEL